MIKLVAIGLCSEYKVYINLSKEDAKKRYNEENPEYTIEDWNNLEVKEIDVEDAFWVYDIWSDEETKKSKENNNCKIQKILGSNAYFRDGEWWKMCCGKEIQIYGWYKNEDDYCFWSECYICGTNSDWEGNAEISIT